MSLNAGASSSPLNTFFNSNEGILITVFHSDNISTLSLLLLKVDISFVLILDMEVGISSILGLGFCDLKGTRITYAFH